MKIVTIRAKAWPHSVNLRFDAVRIESEELDESGEPKPMWVYPKLRSFIARVENCLTQLGYFREVKRDGMLDTYLFTLQDQVRLVLVVRRANREVRAWAKAVESGEADWKEALYETSIDFRGISDQLSNLRLDPAGFEFWAALLEGPCRSPKPEPLISDQAVTASRWEGLANLVRQDAWR